MTESIIKVTFRHKEQKISTDEGSTPATLPKVDLVFHSSDDVSEMSSRADERPERLSFN